MSTNKEPSSAGPAAKPPPPNWEWRFLKEHEPFRLVFLDGKTVKAKLVAMNQFNLVVETARATLLVPKHSVKYYILEGKEGTAEKEEEPAEPGEEKPQGSGLDIGL